MGNICSLLWFIVSVFIGVCVSLRKMWTLHNGCIFIPTSLLYASLSLAGIRFELWLAARRLMCLGSDWNTRLLLCFDADDRACIILWISKALDSANSAALIPRGALDTIPAGSLVLLGFWKGDCRDLSISKCFLFRFFPCGFSAILKSRALDPGLTVDTVDLKFEYKDFVLFFGWKLRIKPQILSPGKSSLFKLKAGGISYLFLGIVHVKFYVEDGCKLYREGESEAHCIGKCLKFVIYSCDIWIEWWGIVDKPACVLICVFLRYVCLMVDK